MKQVVWVFLLFANVLLSQTVGEVRFEGLSKTNESFVSNILLLQPGKAYTEETLDKDLAFLERLNFFFSIDTLIDRTENGVNITFQLKEASSLYPIFFISGFQNQLKTSLGFNEIHFRGRFERLGFQHQYYDRHSFSVFYEAPFWNRKWGGKMYASKYSTIEPLYGADTTSLFNFDNYSIQFGLHRWINRSFKIGLIGAGFREFYKQLDDADLGLDRKSYQFTKYQVKLDFDWNRLRYKDEKVSGWRARTEFETVQTIDFPAASFLKNYTRINGYTVIGQRHNLGAFAYSGVATNRFSPFSPFVVDGFINV